MMNFAENMKAVEALKPQAGAALTGDYVSLKNCHKAIVVIHINQANAATMAISLMQASAVAPTGAKATTVAHRIWANEDCVTSDVLVRQTDAISFTTSAAIKDKIVVFEVDPATLDLANGFDCLAVKTGASNAANITAAMYFLVNHRYQAATPPSGIVD